MATLKIKKSVNVNLMLSGLIAFLLFIFFVDLQPANPKVTYTAGIALLMAFWWITEAMPIGITSLLPLVLFPIMGVLDGKAVSNTYINYVIFLFIGGFIMALAMEKWNLHKRIALKVLSVVGGSPFKILFGFMAASAFLSMWMSNTATAMMMLPIAFSVSTALEEIHGEESMQTFIPGLLLSIAHACSIGGVATLVGTPPNLSFLRIFEIIFPQAPEISFGQWLLFALPLTVIIFSFSLFILYVVYKPKKNIKRLDKSFFIEKYKELGKATPEEKRVFVLFILLVFLWVFRKEIDLGFFKTPGWSNLFNNPNFINDGTVAIFMASLLFIIPSSKKNRALVTWKITKKIPWHIVFLFGGGFALAKGFLDSGLSAYMGGLLSDAKNVSPLVLISALTGIMSILTEFTSNIATTEMMLPLISSLAVEIKMNPLLLMIPVTLAASMAFMFPIATPPNAIVFGTGKLNMFQMIKTGILINIFSVIIISILMLTWGTVIFNINPTVYPAWAETVEAALH